MSFDIKHKAAERIVQKKVRIGSRVPEENREWLKRHGIVTDQVLPQKSPSFSIASFTAKLIARFEKQLLIGGVFFISLLPLIWFQQQSHFLNSLRESRSRVQSLNNSNYHLRQSMAQLSSINLVQQSEINRMDTQIQGLTRQYGSQVGGFQKGEAMHVALQHVYDSELGRMSYQYDREIDILHQQVQVKEQIISSLESSISAMDGVVVRADPVMNTKAMANGRIAAVNADFQFVVIDIGEMRGAKLGQMVELFHDGALVGYGQIEKLYPDFSGVKVFSVEALAHLQTSDTVFLHQTAVS